MKRIFLAVTIFFLTALFVYSQDSSNSQEELLNNINVDILRDPNNYANYAKRGEIYSDMGRYQEAIADYTRAIKLAPNYYGLYHRRAEVYEKLNMLQEAIADYTSALEIDPDDFFSLYFRGRNK